MSFRRMVVLAISLLLAGAFVCPSTMAKQIIVDDDKVECPTATFTSIQAAVNAASPGDQIIVCKGVYVEQVAIHKPLSVDAAGGAILMPSAMQANSTSLFDGSPLAVALLVSDATDVTVDGLIVDGANSGITGCAPDLFGIAFQNASGAIQRTTVRNFKLAADLNGCQSGTGIFVQSGGGQTSNVAIGNSSIHDYQKNGITANELGTQVAVRFNVVTGLGSTNGAAQNGIQIGFGAQGAIHQNTVTNNVWAGCADVSTCTAVATDILVTQSDGVSVTNNTAGVSQIPIFIDSNSARVTANSAFSALVFDAIRLEGSQNTARNNTVFNGAESGIFIDGDNDVVTGNTITEASVGILKTSTSSGSVIHSNSIFDSPVKVQDPPIRIASLLSPKR
jgi:parallel beta-helix repeat protein